MFPTEADVERRLAELRRRREEIEAEIGDIVRYLELGRRLAWLSARQGEGAPEPREPPDGEGARPAPRPAPDRAAPSPPTRPPGRAPAGPVPFPAAEGPGHREFGPRDLARREFGPREFGSPAPTRSAPEPFASAPPEPRPAPPRTLADEGAGEAPRRTAPSPAVPPPAPPAASPGGGRTEARRYGHELMDAVADALREAGRPLHVSEVYAAVRARGFDLPGRSPVAALNTRLWKRARGGSGIVQDGEATYRLREAEPER